MLQCLEIESRLCATTLSALSMHCSSTRCASVPLPVYLHD